MTYTEDTLYDDTRCDVVVTRRAFADGELFPMHSHRRGQLLHKLQRQVTEYAVL